MMRPASIVNFERLYLTAIALGLVSAFLNWGETLVMAREQHRVQFGPGFVVGISVISLMIELLLCYFIARQASVVAKWILVVVLVIGSVALIGGFGSGTAPGILCSTLNIVATLLEWLAISMLFRPAATRWFAGTSGETAPGIPG